MTTMLARIISIEIGGRDGWRLSAESFGPEYFACPKVGIPLRPPPDGKDVLCPGAARLAARSELQSLGRGSALASLGRSDAYASGDRGATATGLCRVHRRDPEVSGTSRRSTASDRGEGHTFPPFGLERAKTEAGGNEPAGRAGADEIPPPLRLPRGVGRSGSSRQGHGAGIVASPLPVGGAG